ncbi:M28 family metallopeptidase [Candidatus Palauibacter sp.]|uniref:M28 family metallopeptidase n=1 Tax=Candidatus Palauibacter sp. TaxID=3101350 RepID=UPI003CC5EF8D
MSRVSAATAARGPATLALVFLLAAPAAARSLGAQEAKGPPSELAALHDIVASVSTERVEADIRRLAGFGTRHTLSDTLSDARGIGAARRWIKAQFDEISAACGGCLEVSYQTSYVGGTERIPDTTAVVNVLAIQRGTTDPGRYVVMSGDIDSRASRVFAEGTRADETAQVAARRRVTGGEVDSPSRNLARFIDRLVDGYVPNLDMMMVYRLDRFGRGGHHRPFNDVGFPAVRIMDANEDYRRQHQNIRVEEGVEYGDVIDEVEFDFAAKLTAVNAISLAAMAWAPAPPRNVVLEGAVRPSTTLGWDPVPAERAPNLAGYRVYWRPTDAPQWAWSVFVGDVTTHTLENIVIDNYLFGVASVSEGGYESPVVFPWPIGAYEPLQWLGRDPGPEDH